jgi:c(7)-type cytochrome triheme protein
LKVFLNVMIMLTCSAAGSALADGCVSIITYEGKGAGEVVFNRAAHMSKGLTCADCHEGYGFSYPLFEMKRGANSVSMKKMEMGRACGYCHDGKKTFSVTNEIQCSKCHHK